MEEDLALTMEELQRKPYVLLLNPAQQQAAAYNAQHRLLIEQASTRLIAWALQHHSHAADWRDELDQPTPRERAAWMPKGSLAGWRLLWLRGAGTPQALIRATPQR